MHLIYLSQSIFHFHPITLVTSITVVASDDDYTFVILPAMTAADLSMHEIEQTHSTFWLMRCHPPAICANGQMTLISTR